MDVNISSVLTELIEDISFPVIITNEQLEILIFNKAVLLSFPENHFSVGNPISYLFPELSVAPDTVEEQLGNPEQISINHDAYSVIISPIKNKDFRGYIFKVKPTIPTLSHGKYKKLFYSIREGIFIFDGRGKIVEANPAAGEIFNSTPDELSSVNVKSLFPHKSKEEAALIWEEFMQSGHISGLYKYIIPETGKAIYLEFDANKDFIPGFHLAVFSEVTGQKLTEKALRSSEANLKAVLNNNNQSLFLLTLKGEIITLNRRAQDVLLSKRGIGLTEGVSLFKDMDPDILSYVKPLFQKVVEGESIQTELHASWIEPDFWIEIYANPVFDAYGNVESICLTANDISYRKKAELSLKESEARFRSLVQNSSDVILILKEDCFVNYSSASILNVLGYKESEIVGRFFTDFIHPADKSNLRSIISNTLKKNKKIFSGEFRFLNSQRHYLYIEATFNNQFGNEFINGIVVNVRDVSFKRAQEENLLLLERAIDSSKNGIIISDPNLPDNPLVYANKSFESITGYKYHDILGKNCRFLQKNDHDQPGLDVLREALQEQKQTTVVLRNYKKDGTLFWNELSVAPVVNREGKLVNHIGVLNDITDRKIAEDSLLDITKGVSGKDFYTSLAQHLYVNLGVDIVFIGEIFQNKLSSKVLFKDGKISRNFDVPLENTAARKFEENGKILYYGDWSEPIPEFAIPGVERIYYMGVPLADSTGKKIGVLEVRNSGPFKNLNLVKTLLNIFSVRISAEMERDVYISALKSSEQKFRILSENSPDFIYIVAISEKRTLYYNKSTFLGHSVEKLEINEEDAEVLHPSDKERVLKHWRIFRQQKIAESSSIEYRILNVNGEYEWVVNRHSVIDNVEGLHKVILVTLTVITERKAMEENLRESEARLMALVENTSDMVWSVDKGLNFTTINSAFKLFFKVRYKREVAVGDNLNDVFPEDVKGAWLQMHYKALHGERFSTEFVSASGTNESSSYEISYNPIYSNDGLVRGISVFARDITQRKISENAIIRTNFELDSFVYRASHDLRAPLRSVLGLINLIKNEADFEQRNVYLNLVNKSIDKLDNFIADLTNFSRNSRVEVNYEEINFRRIFQECVEDLKFMENAGDIKMELEETGNVPFMSDKMRISIIFHNLLSNAIKYKNKYISTSYCRIIVSVTEDSAEIDIEDNGIGIREEYLARIFDMFFRASHDSYGSGLGLYITKQVVEKLNGTISVKSNQGSGTGFHISLPNNFR